MVPLLVYWQVDCCRAAHDEKPSSGTRPRRHPEALDCSRRYSKSVSTQLTTGPKMFVDRFNRRRRHCRLLERCEPTNLDMAITRGIIKGGGAPRRVRSEGDALGRGGSALASRSADY